jgi:hypothetical protein
MYLTYHTILSTQQPKAWPREAWEGLAKTVDKKIAQSYAKWAKWCALDVRLVWDVRAIRPFVAESRRRLAPDSRESRAAPPRRNAPAARLRCALPGERIQFCAGMALPVIAIVPFHTHVQVEPAYGLGWPRFAGLTGMAG